MGRLSAEDMLNHADRETALRWHLQSNHFPPVPLSMLRVARVSIACMESEDWDVKIPLPAGVLYHGQSVVSAIDACRALHLDVFIEVENR